MVRLRRGRRRRSSYRWSTASIVAIATSVVLLVGTSELAIAQATVTDVLGCQRDLAEDYLHQQAIGFDPVGVGDVVLAVTVEDSPPGVWYSVPDGAAAGRCRLRRVPDLAALSVAEASDAVAAAELAAAWGDVDPSASVTSQDPLRGAVVQVGTPVAIEVLDPPPPAPPDSEREDAPPGSSASSQPGADAGGSLETEAQDDRDEPSTAAVGAVVTEDDRPPWVVVLGLIAVVLGVAVLVLSRLHARRRASRRPRVVVRQEPVRRSVRAVDGDLVALSARADPPTRTLLEAHR